VKDTLNDEGFRRNIKYSSFKNH